MFCWVLVIVFLCSDIAFALCVLWADMKNFIISVWIVLMATAKVCPYYPGFLASIFKAVEPTSVLMVLSSKILHFAEVWYVWCVYICSLMQLSLYRCKMKVLCTWKCIQINFFFQRSMMGFRQASELELLPEHILLWVFKYPWLWYRQHLSLCPM